MYDLHSPTRKYGHRLLSTSLTVICTKGDDFENAANNRAFSRDMGKYHTEYINFRKLAFEKDNIKGKKE
jgi:hypothetical protein